jgi:2-polyprenyl-6-methoxyphenol hydroxylase-like FAD-dependent oxidoreductase
MTPTPRIAVIGAGPGGLTCARVLQRHGIDVAVYERDTGVATRDQGGTLDLHAGMGQIALREAGLLEEFLRLSRPEGQSMRVMSRDGIIMVDHVAADGEDAAPEIDRRQLRALLAESLAPGTIRWDHRLSAVTPDPAGTSRLTFANGTETEVDLVIGADGAWSRVRPLVSAAAPAYTDITFVEAHFDDVDARHPAVAELVGDGNLFAAGDHKGLIAQRNSDHHVRVYIALTTDKDWLRAAGVDPTDTAAVRRALLTAFTGWDARLLRLIIDNDGPYVGRPLHVLPAPHTWPHTAGVTLLGDAAHLMSPFGGFGANLAMLDGAELALALVRCASVDDAITEYERVMVPRGAEHAALANEGQRRFFGPGDRDGADVPDVEAESERYKREAAAYGS